MKDLDVTASKLINMYFFVVRMRSGEVIHMWRQICFERKKGG